MFNVRLQNKISARGLALFPAAEYTLSADAADADAILVRSADLYGVKLPKNLKAISRAGVGVNNIPVDLCTERGIAVFNTPGANANGVKELVLAALLLSSRRIYQGISWAKSLAGQGDDVVRAVEQGKARFSGPELKGKRLGVIGLGAVGVMVANDALALGMEVVGYDRYMSIDAAWGLSRQVAKASSLDQLLGDSDYITLHVPLNDSTRGMLAAREFKLMKPGVRIINLARGELVEDASLLEAMNAELIACYVTDFPSARLLDDERIITFPHLGASTPESEENCAEMAVRQLRDFLEKGVVTNSVNFPNCDLVMRQGVRFVIAHRNIPNMIGQITTQLAGQKLNITELLNHHRNGLGYTIIDVEGDLEPDAVERLRAIDGVTMARVIVR
jgi:D-3-phosphoglycerate dehydrogenase / 2-oxoglutarate reductase